MQKLRFFGKTGTTNNGYDNWYVAFDGKNLTIIWVGYEGARTTKSLGLYGATTALMCSKIITATAASVLCNLDVAE